MTSSVETVTSHFRAQNSTVYVCSLWCVFFLILVTAYSMQSPRRNKIWAIPDCLSKYGGFVKSMTGEAEPSIYFTNPPFFYRPSGTDKNVRMAAAV